MDAPDCSRHADSSRGAQGSKKRDLHADGPKPLAYQVHLTTLLRTADAPHGEVLAVVKQQVVTLPADVQQCSLNDFVRIESNRMRDHMDCVTPAARHHLHRRPAHAKTVKIAQGSRDPTGAVGEMNGGPVPEVDRVMLERNALAGSPNKKMITTCQNFILPMLGNTTEARKA